VISDQNQNHLPKIDLKSKSLTCEVILNKNHFFGVKIKITFKKTNYY